MKSKKYILSTGNEATAHIAYKTNEVCAIYPITPASEMSEAVAEWSADNKKNIYGSVPSVFEMQSEAGVAGALHGALQTGSLATTFTASQGLLLMMPNMYKIAAELTPNVIHVATRSIATHALSVFGDHSDIMAARNTGYAFLGAATVQETMDFALLAQAASLKSRIPFVHFFDGFRTSHESAKIELVEDDVIESMINNDAVKAHQANALDPNNPVIRGTSQGADVFFQAREAVNSFYEACPDFVQEQMDKFALLTGRKYKLFEYVGHPQARQVLIAMGSATETIASTIKALNTRGEKIGLIKVKLFRPFSASHLISALPDSCSSIAVLDRTKEPGATGEPLYLDILQAVVEASHNRPDTAMPKVVGGRYGLSSKEFTPGMVKAIVENLKLTRPKNNFTIGIDDDVTKLSLPFETFHQTEEKQFQAIFYQRKSEASIKGFKDILKIVGRESFVQGYTEIDYRKTNSRSVSHLRKGSEAINAPYLISDADFVFCESFDFIRNDNALDRIRTGGTLLLKSDLNAAELQHQFSAKCKELMISKNISLNIINTDHQTSFYAFEDILLSNVYACFLGMYPDLIRDDVLVEVTNYISKINLSEWQNFEYKAIEEDTYFAQSLLGGLLRNKGNELPVSVFPPDGTYATDTSKFNRATSGAHLPIWDSDACIQCGACSMACPQGAIRVKVYEDKSLINAPASFKSASAIELIGDMDLLNYTVQLNPDQCTSCNNCIEACGVKALTMKSKLEMMKTEKQNWEHFQNIPDFDRNKIDLGKVSQQQLQEPLFKYSLGVDGCGEAPYLKLISQLFGDRMLVANATGASSIFGGALPTTPWSKNKEGRGPAWSNSLFEDNAEFGLGFRLSLDQQQQFAKSLLSKLVDKLDFDLVHDILTEDQTTESQINNQRERIIALKAQLKTLAIPEAKQLMNVADSLVKKSIWIVGGDGWAYDIGFGGLDHVLSSGKNVNILVLDNEVYSNTGGQMSKATPFGATAKFAVNGKQRQKKDLGLMAMNYEGVYVASVAIGADQQQTLKAFVEAERFDGPSLIIAYCHSPAHGINMKAPKQYHKAAVDSGQWLLYRNDPRRRLGNLNTLQLDSKEPSLPIENYLKLENRFSKLFQSDGKSYRQMISFLQKSIDARYDRYLQLASLGTPNREKLIQQNKLRQLMKVK